MSALDSIAKTIKSLDYEAWVAEQLGEYIQFQVNSGLPPDFSYTETLRYWFEQFELKISSASARLLGVSEPAISIWFSTGAIPKLRVTLNICWVLGLTLVQFLSRTFPDRHEGSLRHSIDSGQGQNAAFVRRRVDRSALEHELTQILVQQKYSMLSFEEICAKKLKRGSFVVRQYFPALARAIAKRYLENRRLVAVVRKEQYCASIRTIARFLHARGITPNSKTLRPYLEGPKKLRCEWAIVALHEIRVELGYDDVGEQLLLPV